MIETLEQEATLLIQGDTYQAWATQADIIEEKPRKLKLWLAVDEHHTWERLTQCLRASQSVRVTIKEKYSGLFYVVKVENQARGSVFIMKNDGAFVIG